ncbi:unnamed protein product [Hermetia illucens]|uniref:RNA polymerase II-associated factor 1 homolog n=1 Tax=Hermetia illucens TaxID=343691 RepID=A0A7R8Z015_HERIL|nr:RNA polymerase II-associated factor 1 homolog [Hermetia illucens]CAD7091864.1 unnamed protein product [Hermetia illucens]
MPPTIQNGSTNTAEKRPQRPAERRPELMMRVKYCNSLPDIPFDLKFLVYPFENDRFIQYNPTSLERNYKYEVLTEHDLGVGIDLINRDIYHPDPYAQLDPADEKLLEEDVHTPQDSIRSRQHSRAVSWLRKSEYISTEQTRFQPQTMEKVEAKVGYNVKKSLREETLYLDRDAQIKAIEKTFEDSKKEISKHYSKPNVVPVEILPIFPDFKNWKYPCAQVIFDSDPAPVGKNVPAQLEEMSQAMIRGVMDESGEQFVAYFLPTEDTLEKRRRDFASNILYEDEEEYEYKIAREYNWNVKSKASKGYEENYFFVVRPDGVFYDELETRVRLSKRRQKIGQQPNNTKLVVKHRPLDATEHRMQRYREKQLEQPGDEDDEEEMEVDADEEEGEDNREDENNQQQQDDEERERDRQSRSRSRGKTRSPSNSASRSRSRSQSSRSRSRSRSPAKSKSRSRSKSRPKSRSRSRAKSQSRSRSRSASGSRSRSRSKTKSPSRSRSRTHSPSKSRSVSRSRSRSRSASHSPSRSKSGSRTPSRSRSRSKSKSASRSRSRSASGSRTPSRSRSGSRTPSHSRSATPSGSGSDEE